MHLCAPAPIIVAIDDAGSAEDAVDWAAAEAGAQGSPLRVVHALVPALVLDAYSAGAMMEYADEARALGEELLHQAVVRATEVAPEIAVSIALVDGTVTWALRREARAARLLVVGNHRRHSGLLGLLAGSVPGELAAHAPCPVVVLRPVDAPVAGAARVVVGVSRGRSCSAAIGFAFRAARQRGIPLTLVHVGGRDVTRASVEATVEPPRFIEALGDRAVAQTIARWQDEFPDVLVVPKLLAGEPASVLIAESAGAAMLVLGSRGRGYRLGRLLGSVRQAALANPGCPIAIVRQDHATVAPADAAWQAEAHSTPR